MSDFINIDIDVKESPPGIANRLYRYPQQFDKEAKATMDQALAHTSGSVPGYPAPPANSSYVRTGTLGRHMGAGGSRPDIYESRRLGMGVYEGRIGTNLDYAEHVIGTETQAWMHKGRWWTMKTVATKALPGVTRLYTQMMDRLAVWIGGR